MRKQQPPGTVSWELLETAARDLSSPGDGPRAVLVREMMMALRNARQFSPGACSSRRRVSCGKCELDLSGHQAVPLLSEPVLSKFRADEEPVGVLSRNG